MYIMMFISGIRLRYSKPDVYRAYQVPFKKPGMWILGCMGLISSSFAIFMAFIPPSQLKTGSLFFYELFLILGLFVMCGIPLIIYQFRQPSWKIPHPDE
jgi:amino acid transporter